MIKTLTLHNDTTPRHNEVEPTHGSHSIMPWCCVIVVGVFKRGGYNRFKTANRL